MNADEVWKEFAREVGGTYTDFTLKAKRRVHFRADEWVLVLEQDRTGLTATRLRAQFLNLEALEFSIRPATLFARLAFGLGRSRVRSDDPDFDRQFIANGTPSGALRALLADAALRGLLVAERGVLRTAQLQPGEERPHLDEVEFFITGSAEDPPRLRGARDVALAGLRGIRDGVSDPVAAAVATLLSPEKGHKELDDLVAWDDRPGRIRAAAQLGASGDGRALQALLEALDDPDVALAAVQALGVMDDERAVSGLLLVLGRGGQVATEATSVLQRLGAGEIAARFLRILRSGEVDPELPERYRDSFIEGLLRALDGEPRSEMAHAARALADLHAVQAMPDLERLRRNLQSGATVGQASRSQSVLEAVQAALHSLRKALDLPRPAGPPASVVTDLPTPATACETGSEQLPVPAQERSAAGPTTAPVRVEAPELPSLTRTGEVELGLSRPPLRIGAQCRLLTGLFFMFIAVVTVPVVVFSILSMGLAGLLFLVHPVLFGTMGYAIAWDAFLAQSRERVALQDGTLVVSRKLLFVTWKRRSTVARGTRARLVAPRRPLMESRRHEREVALTDVEGRDVRFGQKLSIYEQQLLVRRLNDALEAQQAPPTPLAGPDQRPSMS